MSVIEKLGKMGIPGFRSRKKWKMVVAVIGYFWIFIVLLALITPSPPSTEKPVNMPSQLNDAAVKLVLGDKVDGYAYDVEVVTLDDLSDAPGKKNVYITYPYVFHNWLLNEDTATEIAKKLYTSQYAEEINSMTVYFQRDGVGMAKLTLDKKDADMYAGQWDSLLWIKRRGWTDSYFDPSLSREE